MGPRYSALAVLIAIGFVLFYPIAGVKADDKLVEKQKVEKIDVEQFDKKRLEKDSVILDVRTPKEFEEGHVPGAVNLDIHDPQFNEKLAKLDKSKTYLVHCAKGYRSGLASTKMESLGFSNLFDFHGGFTAWENAHKPIEKGKGDSNNPGK